MTQEERRIYLIKELLVENFRYRNMEIPEDAQEQKALLRSLMNVRMPAPVSDTFMQIQDEYLTQAITDKGITRLNSLTPIYGDMYLWQGDITTLACDAVVNAANSQMLGCFRAMHSCIDNCIHTYAGIALRNACYEIMREQGHDEPTGQAKITPAFNLPSKYVIHTVGPIVNGELCAEHSELLVSSYKSCLELAEKNGCSSIAFCCISTGVFGFPQYEAAQIAVGTAEKYKHEHNSSIKIIFNVFKDEDLMIYRRLLEKNNSEFI